MFRERRRRSAGSYSSCVDGIAKVFRFAHLVSAHAVLEPARPLLSCDKVRLNQSKFYMKGIINRIRDLFPF